MNVCIVGSHSLPIPPLLEVMDKTLDALRSAAAVASSKPPQILLRHPREGVPGPFEALVSIAANARGYDVRWCYPDRRGGREGTYVRDAHMVGMADLVLAFFTPGSLMVGGTGHVVEKALDKDIPVQAYEIDESGLRWVGGVE